MGWPKYEEDNYEAFYERQAWKGENDTLGICIPAHPVSGKISIKDLSSFSNVFAEKSCFSF